MKAYIFVFTGEFGYELLNWQGVVRYFSTTINRTDDVIVCCSRRGLHPLYDFCDLYIDISDLPLFKNSVADMYYSEKDTSYFEQPAEKSGLKNDDEVINSIMAQENQLYRRKTEEEILDFVGPLVRERFPDAIQDYVFSSRREKRNDICFSTGGIYTDLDLTHNKIIKINPDSDKIALVRKKLPFDLSEPFVLLQTATRDVVIRSTEHIDHSLLIDILASKINIVLLVFNTGRNLDSSSRWEHSQDHYFYYECSDFSEQSVLIANALSCVFFTEGDFRSHNYIPPLMGKDVFSVAPQSVFDLPSAPISFWNKHLFIYGGQIIPVVYDHASFTNKAYCTSLATRICYGK